MDLDQFLKSTQEARVYGERLRDLLNETKHQPPIPGHYYQEYRIATSPNLKILCSIAIPPPIQALYLEEEDVRKEARGIASDGGFGTPYYTELITRLQFIQTLIQRWIDGELEKPDIAAAINQKEFFVRVGASWELLVVSGGSPE